MAALDSVVLGVTVYGVQVSLGRLHCQSLQMGYDGTRYEALSPASGKTCLKISY